MSVTTTEDAAGPESQRSGAGTATTGAPRKKRSAGRDLRFAIPVGIFLGGIVLFIVFVKPWLWVPFLSVTMAIATWEVFKRLRQAGFRMPLFAMLAGGQAMIWLSWPFGVEGVLGAYVGTVLGVMIWRLFLAGMRSAPRNYLRDVAASVFVVSWIPLFGAMAALLADGSERSGYQILTFMLVVVCSDIGGYVAGVLFGKRPMAPKISPKKSWEGFGGSLLLGTTAAVLMTWLVLDRHPLVGVALGVGLVICATLGDLIESQVKRDLGIKDMGTLLPGHGGIMDRADGLLPSAAVTWLVLMALG